MKKISFTALILILPLCLTAQSNRYLMFNTTKVRPLAMGSAFTAVGDALSAIQFNPAGYFFEPGDEIPRLTMYLNPISPFTGGLNHSDLYSGEGSKVDDVLIGLGLLLKSMSFNFNAVQLGFMLSEESLSLPDVFFDDDVTRVRGFRQNHSHALVGRLKLADKVSVGATANFLFGSSSDEPEKRQSEIGISYGVLLRPEKGLNIGVLFVDLPDTMRHYRLRLERLVDESVNIGVSYEMFTKTLFALDVRNLGEEGGTVVRELHFGIEQILLSQLALRAGYFNQGAGNHVFSWGLGLVNDSFLFDFGKEPSRNFCLNYAFVYEKSMTMTKRWHLLSLLIKI